MAKQEEAKVEPKLGVVWAHNFPFEEREMRANDWTSLGVKDGKMIRWNADNNWTVLASDLSFLNEDQLQTLVDRDGNFTVVEV